MSAWLLTESQATTLALVSGAQSEVLLSARPAGLRPDDTLFIRARELHAVVAECRVASIKSGGVPTLAREHWKQAGFKSMKEALASVSGATVVAVLNLRGVRALEPQGVDSELVQAVRLQPLSDDLGDAIRASQKVRSI